MTFSILGICPDTNMTGVAITTSSISVGSRCPHVRAGAGAVSTQNITDPSIGPEILALLAAGQTASDALSKVMTNRPHKDYRQVIAIDLSGDSADFTGTHILGTNAVARGAACIAAGNLLADDQVPAAMVQVFTTAAGTHLAERLITALQAGIAAGGEEGPTHSAAVLVAHEHSWPLVDLRVDWTDDCPGEALYGLWQAYAPQLDAYNLRAINPSAAPSYGVAGDE